MSPFEKLGEGEKFSAQPNESTNDELDLEPVVRSRRIWVISNIIIAGSYFASYVACHYCAYGLESLGWFLLADICLTFSIHTGIAGNLHCRQWKGVVMALVYSVATVFCGINLGSDIFGFGE
jgi:hypothetical protein